MKSPRIRSLFAVIDHLCPKTMIGSYVEHYQGERNHQGLANQLIVDSAIAANNDGDVVCDERLGGLLKFYRRAA